MDEDQRLKIFVENEIKEPAGNDVSLQDRNEAFMDELLEEVDVVYIDGDDGMLGIAEEVVADGEYVEVDGEECHERLGTLERLCDHMYQIHSAPTKIKHKTFENETEFQEFLDELECGGNYRMARGNKVVKGTVVQYYRCNRIYSLPRKQTMRLVDGFTICKVWRETLFKNVHGDLLNEWYLLRILRERVRAAVYKIGRTMRNVRFSTFDFDLLLRSQEILENVVELWKESPSREKNVIPLTVNCEELVSSDNSYLSSAESARSEAAVPVCTDRQEITVNEGFSAKRLS
ncbi:hypothetical protein NECAME_17588 [Necator americanus]|uniref:Uncharacterized protein n=1 Tax=Necator americanus TaxID=51031 RepID=W2TPR3_NECAM|nr:hypothetical protein NECAME_17588 [Necator americanus]ETN82992.1 hypothetical protein NECAME_17588 [Necator americanus]